MRTVFLFLLLAFSILSFSQADTVLPGQRDTVSLQQAIDSTNDYLEKLRQKEWEDRNLAGLNMLMEQQKEQKAKQKRAAMLRIGIGVFFLIILIVGLSRKRKKTAS